MFYNCENCFDPDDDPTKNDDDYTPQGARHWTSFRQWQKLMNLAQVVVAAGGGIAPAVVGLAEVENDSVMLRLTQQTPLREWEYHYVMTHCQDVRGINVALMYQPLDFRLLGWSSVRVTLPEGSRPTRDLLHAWGRVVGGDTLDVVVCHLPSRRGGVRQSAHNRQAAHRTIAHLCDSLQQLRRRPHVLVMGDMNDTPDTRQLQADMHFGQRLTNLMEPIQRDLNRGRRAMGTHKYDGVWGVLDQFWVNDGLSQPESGMWVDGADVLALPFMLTEDATHMGHRPLRSYYGNKYEGGYSDHLPIILNLHICY